MIYIYIYYIIYSHVARKIPMKSHFDQQNVSTFCWTWGHQRERQQRVSGLAAARQRESGRGRGFGMERFTPMCGKSLQEQCPRVMNLVGGLANIYIYIWDIYIYGICIYMGYIWDIYGIYMGYMGYIMYGLYGYMAGWWFGSCLVIIVSSIVMMIRSDFHSYFSVGGRST